MPGVNSKALYFAAIIPPKTVSEEVKKIKLEFKERFSASHALKLPAHLTLIPPVWLENEQEKPFVESLQAFSKKQLTITIALNDFGHFGQRAIFINIINDKPVKELHKNLHEELKGFLPQNAKRKLHPHFTLATRDLSCDNFQRAWKEFRDRKYYAEFDANGLTLFKHDAKIWEVLKNLDFRKKD